MQTNNPSPNAGTITEQSSWLTGASARLQMVSSEQYTLLSHSPEFASTIGVTIADGNNFLPLISGGMPPESLSQIKAVLAHCGQSSSPSQMEFRYATQSNGRRWLRITMQPYREGDILFVDLQLFDVTKQGAPDHSRCHRDCRISMLVETMADGYWEFDIPSGHVNVSDSFLSMLGFGRSEFDYSYNWWRELLHLDDLPVIEHELQNRLSGKLDHFELVYRLRTRSGDYMWVLSRAKVTERNPEGRAVHLIGTQIDLTEQKLLEQGARDSELAYRTIFDESPFSVLLSRANGELVDVNKRYLQRTGRKREEVIG